MRINHNIAALNTYRQLSANSANGARSLEKLSSGLRINKAGDDAAGLAISEKMRGQIRGLDQAQRNAQDSISLIQTAEGALNETHSILQRMRELAVQSSNDTNTAADRSEIQKEIDQLATEVTRISTDTEFNTKKLLNGDMGKTFSEVSNTMTTSLSNLRITGSTVTGGTYNIITTAAGTDTRTVNADSATDGDFVATDITVANGTKFGSYTLNVSDFNGVGNTADFTLTGPDGTQWSADDQSITSNALALGGITFNFSAHDVTSDGDITFTLTNAGIDFNLTGPTTSNPNAIASYAGETINLGGFEFTARWGTGAGTQVLSVDDSSVKFHIGANADQSTSLSVNAMSAASLGVNALNVTNQAGANAAIDTIDEAITSVSAERSKLGAMQNRLEHTIANLGTTSENLTASESRIRDVDMAKEMMEFTKNNILSQAAQAMLAQANQQPQGVLQLLR